VEKFKFFGMTLTSLISIHEEIKSTLKSGNACYDLVQYLLSSSLLPKYIKIKIHITKILPETWCSGGYLGLRGTRQ
jgi:hypothetical protein